MCGVLVEIKEQLADPSVNPRNLKVQLGQEIVRSFYGDDAAHEALDRFTAMFVKKEVPDDIDEYAVPASYPISLVDFIVERKLAASKGEAQRLIDGGGFPSMARKLQIIKECLRLLILEQFSKSVNAMLKVREVTV